MNDDQKMTTDQEPKVIGFLCERSVSVEGRLGPDQSLADMPNVKIILIPCSGMMKPSWIETAFKSGADGVFVCGCRAADCTYREGNYFCYERMRRLRPPVLKRRVDTSRIAMFFYSVAEWGDLKRGVIGFCRELKAKIKASPKPEAEPIETQH